MRIFNFVFLTLFVPSTAFLHARTPLPSVHAVGNKFSALKTSTALPALRVKDIVKNDQIFRINSVVAGFFGLSLFTLSDLIYTITTGEPTASTIVGGYATELTRNWSLFILAISAITFQAPSFAPETKRALRRTIGTMYGALFANVTREIFFRSAAIGVPTAVEFIVSAVTAGVFFILAYGYFIAETNAEN